MTTPYTYQLQDVRKVHRLKGRALIAWEMGLGKTLHALLYAQRHPQIRPIIVVCPASLKWNWEKEAKMHIGMQAQVLSGTKPQNYPFLQSQLNIINYDILMPWMGFLQRIQPKLIIVDECQYLLDRHSKRSQAVKTLCKGVPHILALSGTPLTNRPAELWPTLNILQPTIYSSFWPFCMRYCNPKRTHWGWDIRGSSHLDELHAKLSTLMIRRKKVDVLKELPSKQRTILPLELPNRKEYDLALNDFLVWLKKFDPVKVHNAEKAKRLTQLGYLKRLVGVLKLPLVLRWVEDFLQETEEKLVIFAIHRKVIKGIQKKFPNISVVVDGSVIGKNRYLSVQKFQTDPKVRLFIGNVKAAGVGINLTASSTVAFAEIGWTPGECSQAEDRCHRIGSKYPVFCYYLVAKDTIEQDLLELIQKKQKVLSKTLDGKGVTGDLNIFDLLLQKLKRESHRR